MISDSLEVSFALRSPISLADSAAAAVAVALDVLDASDGRGACRVVPVVVPDDTESRFFASATAPVPEGLVAVRVVAAGADEAVVDDREVVVDIREGTVPEAARGFLAAAVVPAAVVPVLGLLGELGGPLGAVEIRRADPVAPETGARFFSSSETDGRER
jgi:hypothetical protein